MTKESEIRILESCANGDAAAFEPIVRQYQSLVCAITYSAVGQVEKSEELAQQVFINAWKGLGTLKDLENFKAWLVGITRNVIRDWFRRQKRDIVAQAAPIDAIGDAADESAEPLEAIITKEQEAIVQQSLQRIPEKYREPMVLFYRQQQSTREVAEALDISEETVRTRLMRGRQMLKDQVARMVESTLSHTGPGKAFTTMVVASIAGLALTSGTASAATGTTTATGTSTVVSSTGSSGLAALTTGITAKIITAAAVVAITAGAVFAYKHLSRPDELVQSNDDTKNVQIEREQKAPDEKFQESADVFVQANEPNLNESDSNNITSVNQEEAEKLIEPAVLNTIQIGIHVFDDKNERPIEGAQLRVNKGCGCNCDPDYYKTDDNGFYKIDFGTEKPSYLSILVSKDGHVPQMFAWRDEMLENLEKEFAFFLPKGRTIGGVIENERGKPIASAKVIVYMNGDESREFPWTRISDYTTNTDPNGRWVCDVYPEEPDTFSIKLRHSDYADTYEWINEREYKYEDFYNLKSKLVMKDGILLSGIVIDSMGNPIKDASVFTGEDRFDDESPRTKTDSQGYFEFSHFIPRLNNRIVLTIQAEGYAPELKVIPMRDEIGPLTVMLGQPNTIRVRVVDVNGNPVAGAGVDVDNWRSFRSLKWTSKTDTDGRFVWNDAPDDEVDIDIYKDGFLRVSEHLFVAREEEYEVVMLPPLVVSGTVIDAETKESIPYFTACKGIQWEGGGVHWETDVFNSKEFNGGRYEMTFDSPYPGHLVRIDAEGYLPAKSRVFESNEATVTYNFELTKGTGPGGMVYDPNGLPAEGAEIYVIMQGFYLSFDNGKPSNEPDNDKYALTDIDGTFSFKGLLDDRPYKLVVMHDYGFAEVSKENWQNDPNIYLQQWGRIEGTLYSGLKAASNQGVSLSKQTIQHGPDDINYYYSMSTVTDDKGYFVIERVIPGKGSVSRRIVSENGRRSSSSGNEEFEINPGQTLYIDIGGGGRTVTGILIKPEWAVDTVEFNNVYPNVKTLQNETMNPYEIYADMEFPMPEHFDEMTVAEVMQWYREWIQGPEGQKFQNEVQKRMETRGINTDRHYNCMVELDGSFEIVDVLPGDYILSGELRKADKNGWPDYKEPIVAEVKQNFTVHDVTEENQDIPVELGAIEFSPIAGLEPGQPVPDFRLRSLNGGMMNLTDFRGKYLLLTFYHAADEGGKEDMKNLKHIQDAFSGDIRLEMAGVTVAGLPFLEELTKKYLAENELTWKQGLIDGSSYELMKTYKIQSGPHSLLIAPDGTLIVNGLKGDELYEAVSDVLANEY